MTTTGTTTTTTTIQPNELEILLEEYEQIVNAAYTPYIRNRMIWWMENGLTRDDLDYALIQTGGAPRPSWMYAEAILRRLKNEKDTGKVTPIRRPGRLIREQQYEQREYTVSTELPEWLRRELGS